MTVFEYLNLRSQWEEIVKDYSMSDYRKQGTIRNIKYFCKHAMVGNRFRKGFDDAMKIAETILEKHK